MFQNNTERNAAGSIEVHTLKDNDDSKYNDHDDDSCCTESEILNIFEQDKPDNIKQQDITDDDIIQVFQGQRSSRSWQARTKRQCIRLMTFRRRKYRALVCMFYIIIFAWPTSYFLREHNKSLSGKIWYDSWYWCSYCLCIFIAYNVIKLYVVWLGRFLQKREKWQLYFITDFRAHRRPEFTVGTGAWLCAFKITEPYIDYEFNPIWYKIALCIFISMVTFTSTYIFVRWVALRKNFSHFRKRATSLQIYMLFIKIMLDLEDNKSLFCVSIVSFLVDFPTYTQITEAYHRSRWMESFTFLSKNINIDYDNEEYKRIIKLATKKTVRETLRETVTKTFKNLLDTKLYTINCNKSWDTAKIIDAQKLNRVTMLLSCLIMVRMCGDKESSTIDNINFMTKFEHYDKASFANDDDDDDDDDEPLLTNLGKLAWNKFRDSDEERLSLPVLNYKLRQIIEDLLKLKESMEAYKIIINNLQRIVDTLTPMVLLFVFLIIFNFDLTKALTVYVSSIGAVAFFAASYLSRAISSLSFIIGVNPFVVGENIKYKEDAYEVISISNSACIFKQLKTGQIYTFQNKLLCDPATPIINLSRSETMRYRWTLYLKSKVDNKQLTAFLDECKKEILNYRKQEMEKPDTESEWKIWESMDPKNPNLTAKATKLDVYGRKIVHIEMPYEYFSWNVNTVCFNIITNILDTEFRDYKCDLLLPKDMEFCKNEVIEEHPIKQ